MSARLRWTLLAAVVAHAAAYGLVSHAHAERDRGEAIPPPEESFELDVELGAPPESVEAPAGKEQVLPAGAIESTRPTRAGLGARSPKTGEQPGIGGAEGEPLSPGLPTEGDGAWTFPGAAGTSGASPLAGAALDTAVRSGVRATLEDARRNRPVRALLPPFDAHDIQLGLAPGSALAPLTETVVRRSRVPTEGHALLRFDSDAAGTIAAVHVLDVSSGMAEWNEASAQLLAQARSRPVRVPAGARGVSVTVEVTSAMKTIDGGRPASSTVGKVLGAVADPLGAAIGLASHEPLRHVVAARVVDVEVL